MSKNTGRRDSILESANKLFCEKGYKATGIDEITKISGAAKMTLYSHFASKDVLIEASLKQLHETNFQQYKDALQKFVSTPKKLLENIFVPVELAVESKTFWGCPFVRASQEFVDTTHPAHQEAIAYKKSFLKFFEENATKAKLKNAKDIALRIQIVFDGTMALYQVYGDDTVFKVGKKMVQDIVEKADA